MSCINSPKEWQPDSDTQIIDEQTIISPISFKLCCVKIVDIMSKQQLKLDRGELICSRLDEILAKSVGALEPSTKTLFGLENKAFKNTQNRLKLATIIADEVRLQLDKKLAGEAKEMAFKSIDGWLSTVTAKPAQEPSTERARKAFAKAVEAGYIEKTATGYRWLYNGGSKASLSYFVVQVYNPDGAGITPYKALDELFGVSRLDSAYNKAVLETKQEQKWREPIDELLKEI
jgi:hypothetical protein